MARPGKAKPKPEVASESNDEPMKFDDALRILLAAPPQHRTAKGKADKPARKPKAARGSQPKS